MFFFFKEKVNRQQKATPLESGKPSSIRERFPCCPGFLRRLHLISRIVYLITVDVSSKLFFFKVVQKPSWEPIWRRKIKYIFYKIVIAAQFYCKRNMCDLILWLSYHCILAHCSAGKKLLNVALKKKELRYSTQACYFIFFSLEADILFPFQWSLPAHRQAMQWIST